MVSSEQKQMYLIYIDESYDQTCYAYSAIFVPVFQWNEIFNKIVTWRNTLFVKDKIPPDYELHATKFVGGQGEPQDNRDKNYQAQLFSQAFEIVENIEGIKIINGITKDKKKYMKLFEYMLNRINRTLEADNAYGILVCDEGNESQMISMTRKMKKDNHIPSNDFHRNIGYGQRNIPLGRIVEDPLFKTSKSSYFIQLADFVAFALLRSENPLEATKENVRTAFERLDSVLVKVAFSRDPKKKGIIRI